MFFRTGKIYGSPEVLRLKRAPFGPATAKGGPAPLICFHSTQFEKPEYIDLFCLHCFVFIVLTFRAEKEH